MEVGGRRSSLLGVLDRERARLTRCLAQQAGSPVSLIASLRAEFVDVPPSLLHRSLQARAERLVIALEDGASISEAMAGRPGDFAPWEIALVRAGERSGDLPRVLEAWTDRLVSAADLKDAASNALIYPLTLLLSAGLSWVVLLATVIPTLARLYTRVGEALPLSTRVLISLSNLFVALLPALLLALLVVLLAALVATATTAGRSGFSRLRYRLPLLGRAARCADRSVVLETLTAFAATDSGPAEALSLTARGLPSAAGRAEILAEAARLTAGESVVDGPVGALLDGPTRRALARAWAAPDSESILARLARSEGLRGRRSSARGLATLEPFAILVTGCLVALGLIAALHPLVSLGDLAAWG